MATRASTLCLVSVGLALAPVDQARAEDPGGLIRAPRSVGRAGTSTVSGDSGIALLSNPGGMVRRSQARFLLSTSVADSDSSFRAQGAPDAPTIVNRAGPASAPLVAYHHGNESGTWVLGALLMSGRSRVSLPSPALGQPPDEIAVLFPHRYGGTQWQSNWRRLAFGGALRIGESLGIGLSGSLAQVELRERRHIWAGFSGRDTLLSAEQDMALQLSGVDAYNPGASLGLLVAPPEIPLEFALAGEFRRGLRLRQGQATLTASSTNAFPSATTNTPHSSLRLPSHYDLRAGVRYLGERTFVEAGAEFYLIRDEQQRVWSLQGLQVVDQSSLVVDFDETEALTTHRSHMALRAALDYEAVPGFLWLTGGYAYHSPSTSQNRRTPGYAGLGGHTLAAGLETAYEDFTITLGYARRLERTRAVSADASAVQVINPFDAGSAPANSGSYTHSSDQLGFAVEMAWP